MTTPPTWKSWKPYWPVGAFEYETAADGFVALEKMNQAAADGRPFRMAILDMQMPGMDGAQLARQIKDTPAISDTILLILTSMGEHMPAERMRSLGLSGYLTKPVRQSRLFDAIIDAASNGGRHNPHAAPLPAETPDARRQSLEGARILLAEDNEVNQMVASEILERAGCQCTTVNNGRDAMTEAISGQYDVVLMDCQMPLMDGFEATRAIRAHESISAGDASSRRVPVIALTANAVKGDRELCLQAGMDGYLTKPINPPEMLSVIASHLPERRPDVATRPQAQPSAAVAEHAPPVTADSNAEESAGADALDASPFDLDSLLARCLDNVSFCRRILEKFSYRSEEQLNEIRQALSARDSRELHLKAHALKGAAANLSADDLRACAAQLEQVAPQEDWSRTAALVTELANEVARCRRHAPRLSDELAAR